MRKLIYVSKKMMWRREIQGAEPIDAPHLVPKKRKLFLIVHMLYPVGCVLCTHLLGCRKLADTSAGFLRVGGYDYFLAKLDVYLSPALPPTSSLPHPISLVPLAVILFSLSLYRQLFMLLTDFFC